MHENMIKTLNDVMEHPFLSKVDTTSSAGALYLKCLEKNIYPNHFQNNL